MSPEVQRYAYDTESLAGIINNQQTETSWRQYLLQFPEQERPSIFFRLLVDYSLVPFGQLLHQSQVNLIIPEIPPALHELYGEYQTTTGKHQDLASVLQQCHMYQHSDVSEDTMTVDLRTSQVVDIGCGNPDGIAGCYDYSIDDVTTWSPVMVTLMAQSGIETFGIDVHLNLSSPTNKTQKSKREYPFFAADPLIISAADERRFQIVYPPDQPIPGGRPASLETIFRHPFIRATSMNTIEKGKIGLLRCTNIFGNRADLLISKSSVLRLQEELLTVANDYLAENGIVITDQAVPEHNQSRTIILQKRQSQLVPIWHSQ